MYRVVFQSQGKNILISIYIGRYYAKKEYTHIEHPHYPHFPPYPLVTPSYISAYKKLPSWSTYSIVCFVTQYPCSSHGRVGYEKTPVG
jgi:hypothetical protein